MKRLILMVLVCCVPLLANAQDTGARVLYCVDELAVGFGKKNGKYVESGFTPKRFSIRVTGPWTFVKVDDQLFQCLPMGDMDGASPVVCKSKDPWSTDAINIDKISLRYSRTRATYTGYLMPETNDSENLYAGKCEEF